MPKKFLFNESMAKAFVRTIPEEAIADLAAEGRAEAEIFTCMIRDGVMSEITIGHALVVIAYGSEGAIQKIKSTLVDVGKD